LKNKGALSLGPATPKADIIIAVADADFVSLASGKLNGQKAFMTGKIKIKGNMMLATSNVILTSRIGLCFEVFNPKFKALRPMKKK
jgi:putative sterol carrier protein